MQALRKSKRRGLMSALMSEIVGAPRSDRAADIYVAIFDAVVDHRLPPGAKLPEEQIGALFNASRTIVRSAFQALAHDHIVTIERNRGAFVSAPTIADARDIFVSRRILEAGVAREAAPKFDAPQVLRLRALLREEAEALRKGDRQAAIQLSGTFHLTIAATLGVSTLTRFLRGLISRSSLVIALYGRGPASVCGHADHSELTDALEAHDGERAASLMMEHLDHIVTDLALVPRSDEPTDVVAILRDTIVRR
jgi:DNA-binding GntR family transcriptional regulator